MNVFRPGSTVRLYSGGQHFTVITEQEWMVACLDRHRAEFTPCITWLNDGMHYIDLPTSSLQYVDVHP